MESGFDDVNDVAACLAVGQRRPARAPGVQEGGQLAEKRLSLRDRQIEYLALDRLPGAVLLNVPVPIKCHSVGLGVEIAGEQAGIADDGHLPLLGRPEIGGLDHRAGTGIFEQHPGGVFHAAAQEMHVPGQHGIGLCLQEVVEPVDEMERVGGGDAAVGPRPLESRKARLNQADLANIAAADQVADHVAGRVVAKNVTHLDQPAELLGAANEVAALCRGGRQRLFHKHVFAGFERLFSDGRVRIDGRDDVHYIDLTQDLGKIGNEVIVCHTRLADVVPEFFEWFGDVQLNAQALPGAQVVFAPPADAALQHAHGMPLVRHCRFSGSENALSLTLDGPFGAVALRALGAG